MMLGKLKASFLSAFYDLKHTLYISTRKRPISYAFHLECDGCGIIKYFLYFLRFFPDFIRMISYSFSSTKAWYKKFLPERNDENTYRNGKNFYHQSAFDTTNYKYVGSIDLATNRLHLGF